jgi:protein-disulfide isomerase
MNKLCLLASILAVFWCLEAVGVPALSEARAGATASASAAAGAPGSRDMPAGRQSPAAGAVTAKAEATAGAAGYLEVYDGTAAGFTAEGHPFRGDPNAPVTLIEYSDFLCPFCRRHFSQTLPKLVETYVRSGRVRLVFRDLPLASLHPTASMGHEAALCVAEQGAVRFWQMHQALFRRQGEWNRLPDPRDFLAGVAADIGADQAAYLDCVASGRMKARVEQSVGKARALGFNGTPSFQFVRAETGDAFPMSGAHPFDRFAQWTEALLAGDSPPQPKTPELPVWAKAEGLAPDPKRPGFTMAGDAYKGDPRAPLAVVEFTDFQCPACRRHALETQPALDEAFVETGKVLWVVKHLPLRMHPNAPAAAAAAECAGEQGQFWTMHHGLYEGQDQWAEIEEVDVFLTALAEQVGLDRSAFVSCLTGRKALERVMRDLFDAQDVVRTTPTFVVLYDGKGTAINGAKPLEVFVSRLEKLHEAAVLAAEAAAARSTE